MENDRYEKRGVELEKIVYPGLRSGELEHSIYILRNKIVSFTRDESNPAANESNQGYVRLPYQSFWELDASMGPGLAAWVLVEAGFGESDDGKSTKEIAAEIRAELGEEKWERLNDHLSTLADEKDEDGKRACFLTAVWADLFAEPFGELWLAAMAFHAHFVLQNDFALGYLTALLDQKCQNERHVMRGMKVLESARRGGQTLKTDTARTLSEMARLQEAGHSVARSAEIAFKNNFGSSSAANRMLWRRRRTK